MRWTWFDITAKNSTSTAKTSERCSIRLRSISRRCSKPSPSRNARRTQRLMQWATVDWVESTIKRRAVGMRIGVLRRQMNLTMSEGYTGLGPS